MCKTGFKQLVDVEQQLLMAAVHPQHFKTALLSMCCELGSALRWEAMQLPEVLVPNQSTVEEAALVLSLDQPQD